ncbi:hypothetical protein [Pseudarthrobacter defluvii]|uniref:hypothetical protein n=1 Tax=Pseudarthrobacter defluvii TaxID=410837 RepID=UPI0027D78E98|nr:hypothetical protein [Pseudarthrobacter defluvii]
MALVFLLAACAQGGTPTSPTHSPPSGSGSPACDLITPGIAARIDPGLVQVGQGGKPAGSPAYVCGYMNKSDKGQVLSVSLTSPASAAQIAEAEKTPDCSPVAGIGDFACMQWSGWFRGEGNGASANTVLKAVRGKESLDLRFLLPPPTVPGPTGANTIPDGNGIARALAQATVEAGWGNGGALNVPTAPPVGQQPTTNNPVCALVSPEAVKNAFGATTTAQVTPGEGSCRYTFGAGGTPGPDSLVFAIEFHQGGATLLSGPLPPDGQELNGIGDAAVFVLREDASQPKKFPSGEVPITYMSLQVARGQNMAIFTARILISPDGPTSEQVKDQFVTLVKGIDF